MTNLLARKRKINKINKNNLKVFHAKNLINFDHYFLLLRTFVYSEEKEIFSNVLQ